MVVKQSMKCPPHHWMIDSYNVGRCINEGCLAVKDFNIPQRKESKPLESKLKIGGTKGKRGRPRKHEGL